MAGPAIKVSVSRKTERGAPREKPIPILAFWDNDGRLSGSIEKGVRLYVKLGDGQGFEVKSGKDGTFWINAFDNREPARPASGGGQSPADGPSDDELLEF